MRMNRCTPQSTEISTSRIRRLASLSLMVLALLILSACQADRNDEIEPASPEAAAPERATEAVARPEVSEQASRADAVASALAERQERERDPERSRLDQREELREQMLERRREVLSGRDTDADSSARRAPSPRSAWWEDEALVEKLELTDRQVDRVASAASDLERVRTRARQALASGQRELVQALSQGETERARNLINQRSNHAVELTRAEAAWMTALVDHLDSEQMSDLIRHYPQLALGRGHQ